MNNKSRVRVSVVIFRTPLINWMLIARLFLARPKVVMDRSQPPRRSFIPLSLSLTLTYHIAGVFYILPETLLL